MSKRNIPSSLLLLFVVALLLDDNMTVHSFTAGPSTTTITSQTTARTSLAMVPRYDPISGRWEPTTADDDASAGYPPVGSLIRQGPVPFLQRLKDADNYDQGVLKMMASEGMSRGEAQGNMDAYLLNPNDWALQKIEEKNGAAKFDYANANMDDGDLILTGTWAGILLLIAGRVAYVSYFGCDEICRQTHF
jgi:hypothetical protein